MKHREALEEISFSQLTSSQQTNQDNHQQHEQRQQHEELHPPGVSQPNEGKKSNAEIFQVQNIQEMYTVR